MAFVSNAASDKSVRLFFCRVPRLFIFSLFFYLSAYILIYLLIYLFVKVVHSQLQQSSFFQTSCLLPIMFSSTNILN